MVVGGPQGIGNDTFSVTKTNVLSGGQDGDVYNCTAPNGVSPDPANRTELIYRYVIGITNRQYYYESLSTVASAPNIENISATAVRMEHQSTCLECPMNGIGYERRLLYRPVLTLQVYAYQGVYFCCLITFS